MRTQHRSLNVARLCGGVLRLLAVGWLMGHACAPAQEMALSWDDCASGVTNKTFACDVNAGSETIVVSFTPGSVVPKLVSAEALIYVCFPNLTNYGWWQVLGPPGCRAGALTASVAASGQNCGSIWDPAAGVTVGI